MQKTIELEKLNEVNESFKSNNFSLLSTLEDMINLVENKKPGQDESEFWREWSQLQDAMLYSKGNLLTLLRQDSFADEDSARSEFGSRRNSKLLSAGLIHEQNRADFHAKLSHHTSLPMSAGGNISKSSSIFEQLQTQMTDTNEFDETLVYPATNDMEIVAELKRSDKKKMTRVLEVNLMKSSSRRTSYHKQDNPETSPKNQSTKDSPKVPFDPPLVKNFFIAGIEKNCLGDKPKLMPKMKLDPQLLYIWDSTESQEFD